MYRYAHTYMFWPFFRRHRMKNCNRCKKDKPSTNEFFHRNKSQEDGFQRTCKECRKLHYQNNKTTTVKYYQKNKEDIKSDKREDRKNNPEKYKALDKKYDLRYRDRKRQKYYENWNSRRKVAKRYKERNKHRAAAAASKRRADKNNQTPDYANLSLINRIYKNCPKGYHVDHMVPISKGGLHYESNLCYLPAKINESKNSKSIEDFGVEEFNKHVIYWQDLLD
jgi:hypothetical protein